MGKVLELRCPLVLSMRMGMCYVYAVQYGGHQLPVAIEQLYVASVTVGQKRWIFYFN